MTRLTRNPHYPGDYAHVARCQKCKRESDRREGQAAFDDWYDTVEPVCTACGSVHHHPQDSADARPREYQLFSDNSNSWGQ